MNHADIQIIYHKLKRKMEKAKSLSWKFILWQVVKHRSINDQKAMYDTKIYDCFTFFDEFELLEIRLNILYPYVDYFVIVEATSTYSGKKKPLHYQENAQRYTLFKDKIIHIAVEDMPDIDKNNLSRRDLENYQRDQIKKGLQNCNKQDVILVSDVDEIPNPKKFGEMIVALNSVYQVLTFKQKLYYYYINGLMHNAWFGSTCCKFSTCQGVFESSAQKIRMSGSHALNDKGAFISKGGWHFSYLGGIDRIIKKINSLADDEYYKDKYKDREIILKRIEQGKDLFGRDYTIRYGKIDGTYPVYLLENINKYRQLIKGNQSLTVRG